MSFVTNCVIVLFFIDCLHHLFSLQLLKEINRTSRGLRFRRQTDPKAYIAAYFKDLPTEFTLGDTKIYGDFENKQLLNGQEYIFFVLAILEMSENVSLSLSLSLSLSRSLSLSLCLSFSLSLTLSFSDIIVIQDDRFF